MFFTRMMDPGHRWHCLLPEKRPMERSVTTKAQDLPGRGGAMQDGAVQELLHPIRPYYYYYYYYSGMLTDADAVLYSYNDWCLCLLLASRGGSLINGADDATL